MNKVRQDKALAEAIAAAAEREGGRVYYVGGCVRDSLMGRESKDIDIEVHGILPERLERILDGIGVRTEMGESFGVYGLSGSSIDIAMPRKETCVGRGHRDFKIDVDPFCGAEAAARRRDFTVNAMMRDVLRGTLIDPFGGQADMERKVIRHVCDQTFPEDALRVFRAAQFAARLDYTVAEETVALCRTMSVAELSAERVFEELKKALLTAERPSVFFETLREMEQLKAWFAEVEALVGVLQNPKYHPEGDVYRHTMQVLDRAAARRAEAENPLGLMMAALVHDLGKAEVTEWKNGAWHAYGHETAGISAVQRLVGRLTNHRVLHRYLKNMTELHMKPNVLAATEASVKSTNRMFDASVAPADLILLAAADGGTAETETFLRERLAVYRRYMARPCVQGRDLIAAGAVPGKAFAEALEYARKLHLAGVEKESALKQTLAYLKTQGNGYGQKS